MRTFYDFRSMDYQNPKKEPLQGQVIFKTKNWWLCWIYRDSHKLINHSPIRGFIVAPRTIYLYNVYIASSFWDAVKYFIKVIRQS